MPLLCTLLLVALQPEGKAADSIPASGHPTLLSPHSDPIACYGDKVFAVNTPSDTPDVLDAGAAKITARIPTGIDPVSVIVRPDGKEKNK